MKKIKCTLFVLVVIAIETFSQIPNNGFENWTKVGNCIEPTAWHSMYSIFDSTGDYCPVIRSTDHYPTSVGSYSVMISNDTARWHKGSFLGWGILTSTEGNDRPLFPIKGHPVSLCGYYKYFPKNGDTMAINIYLYKNGIQVTDGHFLSHTIASNWTSFSFSFSNTLYSSVDSARITMSAAMEPKNGSLGPLGNSILYVDNLSFDSLITSSPTSLSELPTKNTFFYLYPNPAFNLIKRIPRSSATG